MRNRLFFAIAFAAVLFTSCVQKEQVQEPIEEGSIVKFIAQAPDTKTSMAINGNKASFSWTSYDTDTENWFHIAQGANVATMVVAEIKAGVMELAATFGSTPSAGEFSGYMNGTVPTTQDASSTAYDPKADVLAAKATATATEIDNGVQFYFKRLTAISMMTLKGLADGDVVKTVTVVSDKAIAGVYDGTAWSSDANTITLNCNETVAGGQVTLWFMTRPVESAQFDVVAVTADNKVYTKHFGAKITLPEASVTPYKAGLSQVSQVTFDLSTDTTATASDSELSWTNILVDVLAQKGTSTTNTNNYYPGTDGQTYSSTRFYKNSTLSITPKCGISVKTISFTATSNTYATALANSSWTNATASANEKSVAVTSINGKNSVSAVIGAATGHTSIVVTLGVPTETKVSSITLDRSTASIAVGSSITLVPTVGPVAATDKSIDWTSSDPSKATVSSAGVVVGVAAGSTTITATAHDGSGVYATCAVTVTSLEVGDGTQLKYTMTPNQNSSNTAYSTYYDTTLDDGSKWKAPGNQSGSGYWRLGGKELTDVTRYIYSKDALNYEITKITVNTNGRSNASLTVGSVKLDVYSTAAKAGTGGDGDVDSLSPSAEISWKTGSATNFSFVKTKSVSYKDCFYRLTFTLSNSTTKNYGVDLQSIQFYF